MERLNGEYEALKLQLQENETHAQVQWKIMMPPGKGPAFQRCEALRTLSMHVLQ